MKTNTVVVDRGVGRAKQRGVVLLISLIMLIAMTLVGLSLMRSTGAGLGIAGNLAFRQAATATADLGVEVARNWLKPPGGPALSSATLDVSNPGDGYYACWYADCVTKAEFNPKTYDWANSRKLTSAQAAWIAAATGKDTSGNEIRYVLHRLCEKTGPVLPEDNPQQKCANHTDFSGLSSKGGGGYGGVLTSLAEQPYFRATVRVTGPRNTTSYIQVVMY